MRLVRRSGIDNDELRVSSVEMTKRSHMGRIRRTQAGFTFAEAIIVIVITGIIAAVVAVFLQKPVKGYFDSTRRAELSDEADTALRRITRDLRLALPNSLRTTTVGSTIYVELLLTKGGGRYRAEQTAAATGAQLDFGTATASFDVIGPIMGPATGAAVQAGDQIVIYNLGAGFANADAYQAASNNRATVQSATASTITLSPSKLFPFESPGKRFQVVQYPVTYACLPNAANPALGNITRYWGYAIQASQPTTFVGASNALVAKNVSACAMSYAPNAVMVRTGVVSVAVQLTSSQESLYLFQQVHVSNVP